MLLVYHEVRCLHNACSEYMEELFWHRARYKTGEPRWFLVFSLAIRDSTQSQIEFQIEYSSSQT